MNEGVMVVLGIVGALVLCEAVLPRLFAVLRHAWPKPQTKEASVASEEALPGTDGRDRLPDAAAVGLDAPPAAAPAPDAPPAAAPAPDAAARPVAASATADAAAEAQRLWDEAQTMAHGYIPDPETDGEYLARVYAAARLGHLGALVKLGDYAFRRRASVEAFYWTILAELKGADGLDDVLCRMRTHWLSKGCPGEFENAYAEFDGEQGEFARAVLFLQCDVDPQRAYGRLQELAGAGNEPARLFLRREAARLRASSVENSAQDGRA